MIGFVFRRLGQSLVVLWLVTVIVLVGVSSSGDPVALLLPLEATAEMAQELREELGLDRSFARRYVTFMTHIVSGELNSFRFHQPALPVTLAYFYRSLGLVLVSMAVTLVLSIPLGVWAAYRRGRAIDTSILVTTYIGQAVPVFWLAMILILLFTVRLGLLPASGTGGAVHWILPVVTLVIYNLSVTTRMMRSSMLNVLQEDYIRTAHAKGVALPRVLGLHAMRNAVIGVISLLGVRLGEMLGGVLVVEFIFAWPGLGWLLYNAIVQRDIPLVLTGATVTAIVVGLTNLLVDVAIGLIDPRVRHA